MLLVLARRLANVVPTLVAVIALVFLLFSVLPGSFISGMGEDGRTTIDPAVMERMRKEMGLDDPLPERFAGNAGRDQISLLVEQAQLHVSQRRADHLMTKRFGVCHQILATDDSGLGWSIQNI